MADLREILRLSEDPLGGAGVVDRDLVERVDAAVEEVMKKGEGGGYLSLLNPLVQGKDAGEGVLYAAGYLQARAGDEIIARQLFSVLCERFESKKRYADLGAVLDRALPMVGTPELARVAARLWEKSGGKEAGPELLAKALEIDDENHRILWAVGASRIASGEEEGGLLLLARSLPGFARKNARERLEEGALYILESPSRETLLPVLESLEILTQASETETAVSLFELTQNAVLEHGLAKESWEILRKVFEKSPDRDAYRKFAAAAGIAAHDGIRDPATLFKTAGIADPKVPAEQALQALDKLLEMPPGRHVLHHGWGVGEILANDGESLTIRFREKGLHRMSVSLAKTALTLLRPTDLRVKVYLDRDGMMAALKENRAEFLYHALVHLGGGANQDDVKKLLVTLGILPPASWADWWKNAKKEAEKDARFDLSQIFRKVIRIRNGKDSSALPEVDLAGNLRKSLDLLFRFLDQHPEEMERLAKRYGHQLQSLARYEERTATERIQTHLLLHRLGGTDDDEFRKSLDEFLRAPELTPVTTEQQRTLLSMVSEDRKAVVAGVLLDSKVQGVRREAWAVLSTRNEKEREREIAAVLHGSPARSSAVIHVVKELAGGGCPDVWACVHALINIVEHPEKENYRNHAIETLRSDELRRCMTESTPTADDGSYLRNRLLNWKHSERYLFPILEAIRGTALGSIADEAESQRESMRPQKGAGLLDKYAGRLLMTRATLTRLRKEAEGIDWDLKTTIPHEIRKAREHGDLRENAEYDAAKQKQAEATKRLGELNDRMRLVKVIEEIEIPDGEVVPGTEVDLVASDGADVTYWILGEGDRELGDEVISYRAPLGEMLLGRKVGDEVGPMNDRTFRIAAIRKRLPEQ
ncbi:MAG: GreA/GreB family elongation factor [Candidatus Eisenbacteria bacterium]